MGNPDPVVVSRSVLRQARSSFRLRVGNPVIRQAAVFRGIREITWQNLPRDRLKAPEARMTFWFTVATEMLATLGSEEFAHRIFSDLFVADRTFRYGHCEGCSITTVTALWSTKET